MVTIPYWFIRYALPVGALMIATAAILVVRPSYESALEAPSLQRTQAAPRASAATPRRAQTKSARASAYSVRSGDTFGTIADRFGTTVEALMVLNPGIDPRTLRVGQTLRTE
jgi:LysM repeat protein